MIEVSSGIPSVSKRTCIMTWREAYLSFLQV
jgi:hypothetical protein